MEYLNIHIEDVAEEIVLKQRLKSEKEPVKAEVNQNSVQTSALSIGQIDCSNSIILKYTQNMEESVIVLPLNRLTPIYSQGYPLIENMRRQSVIRRAEKGVEYGEQSDELNTKENFYNPSYKVCTVCGAKAGKHTYYGGQVCPSCRAFFRRSVQSNCRSSFQCSDGAENCKITLNSRKKCQLCRYKQCLKSGMKPSWILSDEERHRRFGKRRRERRSNKSLRSPHCNESIDCKHSNLPVFPFNESSIRLLQYGLRTRDCIWSTIKKLHKFENFCEIEVMEELNQHIQRLIECLLEDTVNIFNQELIFTEETKYTLSHRNASLLLRLGLLTLPKNYKFSSFSHNGDSQEMPLDLSTKKSDDVSPRNVEEKVYPPSGRHIEESDLQIMDSFDPNDSHQLALIFLLVALSSDFGDLPQRAEVEDLQLEIVFIIQCHLFSVHPRSSACTRLGKIIMTPHLLRESLEQSM